MRERQHLLPTNAEMLFAAIRKRLLPGETMPCCKENIDEWCRFNLWLYGGEEDSTGTAMLNLSLGDLPVLKRVLDYADIVCRFVRSPIARSAIVQPLRCATCDRRSAVVLVNTPLWLTVWRLQMIICGLIESETPREDGSRTIGCRPAGPQEMAQLAIIRDSYFGKQPISLMLVEDLCARASRCPVGIRTGLEHGIGVAFMWVIAHEAAHHLPSNPSILPSEIADVARACAERFCQTLTVSDKARQEWVVELAADALGLTILTHAMNNALEKSIAEEGERRREVLRQAALGTMTALNGMAFANMCRSLPIDGNDTHPSCADRFSFTAGLLISAGLPANQFGECDVTNKILAQLIPAWLTQVENQLPS